MMTVDRRAWLVLVPREDQPNAHRLVQCGNSWDPSSALTLAGAYPGSAVIREGTEVQMIRLLERVAASSDPELRVEAQRILADALPGGKVSRDTRPVDRQAKLLLDVVMGCEHEESLEGTPVDHAVVNALLAFLMDAPGFRVANQRAMSLLADIMAAAQLGGAASFLAAPEAKTDRPEYAKSLLDRWSCCCISRKQFAEKLNSNPYKHVASRLLVIAHAADSLAAAEQAVARWCIANI